MALVFAYTFAKSAAFNATYIFCLFALQFNFVYAI